MGNEVSTAKGPMYHRLSAATPPVTQMGHDEKWNYVNLAPRLFTTEADREQFLFALLTILTHNGSHNLTDHDFKLLYSRREAPAGWVPPPASPPPPPKTGFSRFGKRSESTDGVEPVADDGSRVVPTLVAISPSGVITAKIEEGEGRDIPEALKAFRRGVELRLADVLARVGEVGGKVKASTAQRPTAETVEVRSSGVRRVPVARAVDEPPAYADVKKG